MALPPQYSEDFGGGYTGTMSAGNIQVHTREDSGNSIEEMFRVVTDPRSSISAKPMKDRNFPASFFEPNAHLAPASRAFGPSASKSPSVASSVSPNLDHLYPDGPCTEPSSVPFLPHASSTKSSCGSDLALNETFSNIKFSESGEFLHLQQQQQQQPPQVQHQLIQHVRGGGGSFTGGGGLYFHHQHQHAATAAALHQRQLAIHAGNGHANNGNNKLQLPPGPVANMLSPVVHARAHSSPAKMSNQQQQFGGPISSNSVKKAAGGTSTVYAAQQQQQQMQAPFAMSETYIQYSQHQQLLQQQQQNLMSQSMIVQQQQQQSSHPNLAVGGNVPVVSGATNLEFYHEQHPDLANMGKDASLQPLMDACPLPPGWEMAYSDQEAKIYFVDHNSKSTSWLDPRIAPELQSGWGHTAAEINQLHSNKCSRCSAYRKLTSLTAQKELLRRQLEATTRNEFLMRQEVFTMQGGPSNCAMQQQQQQVAAADHRRQESSDSGLASEPVVTPPILEINGYAQNPGQLVASTAEADTSVDCLLSSLNDSDLLLCGGNNDCGVDVEMQSTFRQDFQESI